MLWSLLGKDCMRFGELLIGQGLATPEQVAMAVERQRRDGGRLGTHLIAMGVLTIDQLLTILRGQQQADAALGLCERTLHRSTLTYGDDHQNTYRAQYNLGRALLAAGRAAESVCHAETARRGPATALGADHAWTREASHLVATARHVAALAGEAQPGLGR
jgi:hypothetical protein